MQIMSNSYVLTGATVIMLISFDSECQSEWHVVENVELVELLRQKCDMLAVCRHKIGNTTF